MKWKCPVWSVRYLVLTVLVLVFATPASAILFYTFLPNNGAGVTVFVPPRVVDPAAVAVPPGFCIEPVVTNLTYPVAVFTDEKDLLYILESGYAYGEDFVQPRLLRVEVDSKITEVMRGEAGALWTGASFHRGNFYVSEGFGKKGGRILRVTKAGQVTVLVDGIPSQGDHHTNKPVTAVLRYTWVSAGSEKLRT